MLTPAGVLRTPPETATPVAATATEDITTVLRSAFLGAAVIEVGASRCFGTYLACFDKGSQLG